VNTLLPFIISGITTGSIYGLAGTGLVLTYKTSGIFNFAHGAMATFAAYLYYFLNHDHGLAWPLAVVISVVVAGPVMGFVMEPAARRLARQSVAWQVVGTIGIVLLVQGLASARYGPDSVRVDQFLPKGGETFKFGGVFIGYDQVTIAVIGVLAVALLYMMFRWTRSGLAMRAVVDDPELVARQATSPARVRRTAWAIGASFAALSGVLVAPLIGLEPIVMTFLVVQAFGAAAIGGFSSISLTFLGGLLIGIASDVSKKYVLDVGWLAGLPPSLPFIALFLVLLLLPRRKLLPAVTATEHSAPAWHGPLGARVVAGVVALGVLALVPTFAGTKLGFYTSGLTQMIMLLSLGLLVRTSGQISLCHAAFAAIGAVGFSQLVLQHGVPWLVAVPLAGLIAVPVGALIAVPAIRLSGLFLALATLGFGIMLERLLYGQGFMFTKLNGGRPMPRPSFAEGDKAYYYVVLIFMVATALIMLWVERARLGRVLRGMSDSPVAVSTMGLNLSLTKTIVFCLSAFFAAISGVLYGSSVRFATTADRTFQSFTSLVLLATLALAPFGTPWFALFALAGPVITGYLTGSDTPYWLNVAFGFFAITTALQGGPPRAPAGLRRFFDQRRRPASEPAIPADHDSDLGSRSAENRDLGAAGLSVRDLSVRFGGLVAVNALSLDVPVGRITGLIGPNGAGKTTTFDVCSGLNRRAHGQILLHGEDVTAAAPGTRARRGLGRTFQRMELCDSLSVFENVALSKEASFAGTNVMRQLAATPAQHRVTKAGTVAAMELCGISHLSDRQVGALSTGERRLVDLARCLNGPFDVLLLDEPSSGLDREETVAFGKILTRVVAERGCGVLLVEHDMSLVLDVCSYIYVLDFGRLIFEGDPSSVAESEIVRSAYLGDESLETAVASSEATALR
jgi:ABC-type branched-subunit amino acid transport system ATPase component/branched-subunit amino acid ABC-type transport system permease component